MKSHTTVPRNVCLRSKAGFLILWFCSVSLALGQSGNQVTLAVNPKTAKVKQKITLTASVTNGGNTASGGTVTFYDSKVALGDIQVVGKHPAPGHQQGTAVMTTILGPGQHSLTAVYGGTAQFPGRVKSSTITLAVTGKTFSATLLKAKPNAENPQNYDFTAFVGGFGFATPNGTVDFSDITSGTDLGDAAIDPASVLHWFRPPHVTQAGGMPAQSVVADFNGDGFPDVATVNAAFGPSTMAVFLGRANGEFQPPVSYPTGVFTSGILAADFNQDGIPDIAAMSQEDGTNGDVAIFLGNGDGTFHGPVDNVLGNFPVAIALGDFNRDGILDFVTVDYFNNVADVSLGNGDGTFQPIVAYPIGSGPYGVVTGDFNGDGFIDIAAVNNNPNTMSVLLGNGDGTFQTQQVYSTGNSPEFITAGDLNGDGNLDLIVANYGDPSVGVFLGKGDGTFQSQVTYPVTGNDSGLGIADMDGDGIPDIVASYYMPAKIGVLHGNGDGTFATVRDFATGQSQGFELSLADLNGDGTPDVISDDIHASISVLLNGTVATAKLSNIQVPGSQQDMEQIVAKYFGSSEYSGSTSSPIEVKGSGTK